MLAIIAFSLNAVQSYAMIALLSIENVHFQPHWEETA